MPNQDGSLTQDESGKVLAWLTPYLLKKHCPVCDTASWQIDSSVARLPIASANVVFGGPYFPLVLVACTKCAYTLPFNAVTIGIMPPAAAASQSPRVSDKPADG